MDQTSIVVILHPRALSDKTKDVHIELVRVFGSDTMAYSIVTKYIRTDVILQNEPKAEDQTEEQGFSNTDNPILDALDMISFSSIHQIAKMTFIRPAIVFLHLTKSLHFALKRLHSVPHRRSDLQKQAWAIMPSYHHVKEATEPA
jgi:hypothetical protein